MIGIRVKGDTFAGLADAVLAELRPAAVEIVRGGQEVMLASVRNLLSRRGSGRFYRSRRVMGLQRVRGSVYRGARGRFVAGLHQASAPGEPPAPDTGEYRDSFEATPVRIVAGRIVGDVVTDDPRAPALEYGGWTGRGRASRILPRPHIRPALDNAAAFVDAQLEKL